MIVKGLDKGLSVTMTKECPPDVVYIISIYKDEKGVNQIHAVKID